MTQPHLTVQQCSASSADAVHWEEHSCHAHASCSTSHLTGALLAPWLRGWGCAEAGEKGKRKCLDLPFWNKWPFFFPAFTSRFDLFAQARWARRCNWLGYQEDGGHSMCLPAPWPAPARFCPALGQGLALGRVEKTSTRVTRQLPTGGAACIPQQC